MHSLLTAFFSTALSNEGDKLREEGKLAKAMEAYKTDYIKNPTNRKIKYPLMQVLLYGVSKHLCILSYQIH